MIYHNAPQRRTGYATKALTPVVSPVTAQELADWVRADDDSDPLFNPILIAATSFVIERLQSELINRERVVVYQNWPLVGSVEYSHISRTEARAQDEVKLPYATLDSIQAVEIYGEAHTDFIVQDTTPSTILVGHTAFLTESDKPAIKVEYTAGYGETANDVPEVIRTAIIMLAAYHYTHRAACSMSDAFLQSGAKEMLVPYMNEVVAL